MPESTASLTRVERAAVTLGRLVNERPLAKRLSHEFVGMVTRSWVRPAIGPRLYLDNIDWLVDADPDRGVVLVANHRSFFDLYVVMLALFELRSAWLKRMFFPVRANFFYERPMGVALNFAVGGGAMYPPLFRDPAKAALNKDALERISSLLAQRGTLVGLHPEGTRGKGPDPYQLLPAQPGVGQIVLQGKPIVVPLFINGLPNNLVRGVADTYRASAQRESPIIIAMGDELDYSELARQKPRAALYKRTSDFLLAEIRRLSERERQIRAACARGEIGKDDPSWLMNARRARR